MPQFCDWLNVSHLKSMGSWVEDWNFFPSELVQKSWWNVYFGEQNYTSSKTVTVKYLVVKQFVSFFLYINLLLFTRRPRNQDLKERFWA